jgi:glycogen(starch) synthase
VRALRILVVSNLYPPAYLGGYELACKDIVDGLRARGHDIYVLTSTYRALSCPAEASISRSLNHYWGDYPDGTLALSLSQAAKSYWLDFTNYRRMKKWIRELEPEFIYLWNLERISPVPILAAVKESSIPFVIHLMDYWLRDIRLSDELVEPMPEWLKRIRWKARKILRRIIDPYVVGNPLIAMSETVKCEFVRTGFLPENIQVVYHGIRTDLQLGEGDSGLNRVREGRPFRILFAGLLLPCKGVDTLIMALSDLVNLKEVRDIRLDIVGQGAREYTEELCALVRQHQLDGFVSFLGFVPRQDLLTKYREYNVFVLPTKREEPFGIVIIEAMISGVPVIASGVGGPAEIITNGETGILVPPGDSVKLATAVHNLMHNEGLRRKIQENALALVRDRFDIERSIDWIESYIGERIRQM